MANYATPNLMENLQVENAKKLVSSVNAIPKKDLSYYITIIDFSKTPLEAEDKIFFARTIAGEIINIEYELSATTDGTPPLNEAEVKIGKATITNSAISQSDLDSTTRLLPDEVTGSAIDDYFITIDTTESQSYTAKIYENAGIGKNELIYLVSDTKLDTGKILIKVAYVNK